MINGERLPDSYSASRARGYGEVLESAACSPGDSFLSSPHVPVILVPSWKRVGGHLAGSKFPVPTNDRYVTHVDKR